RVVAAANRASVARSSDLKRGSSARKAMVAMGLRAMDSNGCGDQLRIIGMPDEYRFHPVLPGSRECLARIVRCIVGERFLEPLLEPRRLRRDAQVVRKRNRIAGIETSETDLACKRHAESQQIPAPEAAGQSLEAGLVRRPGHEAGNAPDDAGH